VRVVGKTSVAALRRQVTRAPFARAAEGVRRASVPQLVPWKRFGKAEEVAPVIAFLASKPANCVTVAQYTDGRRMEAWIGGRAGRRM